MNHEGHEGSLRCFVFLRVTSCHLWSNGFKLQSANNLLKQYDH